MLRALFLSSLTILAISNAHALEPVEPQPAVPLTFTNQAYQKVIPAEALKMIKEGVVVIDVRNPIERLTEGYIKGSVNVPLSSLKSGAKLTAVPDFDQRSLCIAAQAFVLKTPHESSFRPATNMSTTCTEPCNGLTNLKNKFQKGRSQSSFLSASLK